MVDNSPQEYQATEQPCLEQAVYNYELHAIEGKIKSLHPYINMPTTLAPSIHAATRKHEIPEDKFIALGFIESSFDSTAVSYADCIGIWQINHRVHRNFTREKLFIIKNSALEGARILRKYYDRTGCWEKALVRYNGYVPGSTFGTWVLTTTQKIKKEGR